MRSAGWTLLRIAVTFLVLGWVVRHVDVATALAALGRFTWQPLLAATTLVIVDRLLMFWRWRLLLVPRPPLPDLELAHIFFVSAFLGSFLPAGVGGDAARAFAMGRHLGNAGPALASVVVDRWVGLIAVALTGCAGLFGSVVLAPAGARAVVLGATVVLLVGSVVGLFADVWATRLLPARLHDTRLGRAVLSVATAMAAYRGHGRVLGGVALLSLVVQAGRILLAWVLGRGLGIDVPFKYYWVFMPLNILVILLPLSLGGFGLPQGTMVWTLGPLGVSPTLAFLLSSLFVGAGIVGNLPGILLYLVGGAGHGPRSGRPRPS